MCSIFMSKNEHVAELPAVRENTARLCQRRSHVRLPNWEAYPDRITLNIT